MKPIQRWWTDRPCPAARPAPPCRAPSRKLQRRKAGRHIPVVEDLLRQAVATRGDRAFYTGQLAQWVRVMQPAGPAAHRADQGKRVLDILRRFYRVAEVRLCLGGERMWLPARGLSLCATASPAV